MPLFPRCILTRGSPGQGMLKTRWLPPFERGVPNQCVQIFTNSVNLMLFCRCCRSSMVSLIPFMLAPYFSIIIDIIAMSEHKNDLTRARRQAGRGQSGMRCAKTGRDGPVVLGDGKDYSPGQRWQRSASASPSLSLACRSRSAVRRPSSMTGW